MGQHRGCPSSIIGISHGTAQGLSPTDPQNNPQFLPRINAIFPDAEYSFPIHRVLEISACGEESLNYSVLSVQLRKSYQL